MEKYQKEELEDILRILEDIEMDLEDFENIEKII